MEMLLVMWVDGLGLPRAYAVGPAGAADEVGTEARIQLTRYVQEHAARLEDFRRREVRFTMEEDV